jgi:hypothetical protein
MEGHADAPLERQRQRRPALSRALVLLIAFLAAFAPLIVAWRQSSRAIGEQWASQRIHEAVLAACNDVVRLRAARADTSLGARPQAGFVGQVAECTTRAGLSREIIKTVSPGQESDQGIVQGVRVRSQSMRIDLDALTLVEFGRWCEAWPSACPGWTFTSMDIVPSQATPAAAGVKRIRVSITCQASYAEEADVNVQEISRKAMEK